MAKIFVTAGRALVLVLAGLVPALGAQSVAGRTPNLTNNWPPERGVVQFNFTHRFDISDAPLRKITNTPSFQVSTGVAGPFGIGFTYGSNSDLVAAYPNEWEWFARWSPLSQEGGAPLDAALQGGWNIAAESFDAELSAARSFGALRLLVAGRAFHHAFYQDSARYAVAGGAALRLTPWLSLAGDYASLLDRADDERPVWGAGLQLTVPYTPHSLSLHATNVGTGSLEGASRGSHTRWGFEYTVPITLRRYAPRRAPREEVAPASPDGRMHMMPASTPPMSSTDSARTMTGASAAMMSDGAASMRSDGSSSAMTDRSTAEMTMTSDQKPDTVVIRISKFKYQPDKITIKPGDVVVWKNGDQFEHTITSDDGELESPVIKPDAQWSARFTTPGTFTYHCVPHPFMKAQITVKR